MFFSWAATPRSVFFLRQDRLYRAYKELIRWIPSLQGLLHSEAAGDLRDIFQEVSLASSCLHASGPYTVVSAY